MPPMSGSRPGDRADRVTASSSLGAILDEFQAPVSDIVSRSIVTASFNGEDRFEWTPATGLTVSIPDRLLFVQFPRAAGSELRNRLFPFPHVRGHRHHNAPQPTPFPERNLAWWFAQLLHYGLPITCDREQAQESLKLAITRDRLTVPLRLQELETKLKRQYIITPATRPGMDASFNLSQQTGEGYGQPSTELSQQEVRQPKQKKGRVNKPQIAKKVNHQPSRSSRLPERTPVNNPRKSESESLDDSDQDPTPRPALLFTPRSTRVDKFGGSNELPEQENKGKRIKQAQAPGRLQRHDITTHNQHVTSGSELDSDTGSEHNSDASENVQVRSSTAVVGPNQETGTKTVLEAQAAKPDSCPRRTNQDDSADEVESLIFYTPMQFLKKRSTTEDDKDNESVIFSGSRENVGLLDTKHRTKAKKESTKPQKVSEFRVDEMRSSAGGESKRQLTKSSDKLDTDDKDSRTKQVPKSSRPQFSPRKVIEISDDEDRSSNEETQIGTSRIAQLRDMARRIAKFTERKPNSIPQAPIKTNSKKIALAAAPVSGSHEASNDQEPGEKNEMDSRKEKKARKKSRKSHHAATSGKQSNHESSPIGVVQDYTGCGITEMSGALHSADEMVTKRTTKIQETEDERVVRTRSPELPTIFQQSPNLPDSPNLDDSDFDLPSLTGLFTSQDTPEKWKNVGSKSVVDKHKLAIDRSYDPDSVPMLRDALATLPDYLKKSVRHDSPELSHNPTTTRKAGKATSITDILAIRDRSRSVSIAPTSKKRARPSMLEIEANGTNEQSPQSKRLRVSSSQAGHASVLNNAIPVGTTSKKTKVKHTAKSETSKRRKVSMPIQDVHKTGDHVERAHISKAARRRAQSLGPTTSSK